MSLPIVILPGYLEEAKSYINLAQSLEKLGFLTTIVPLKIYDWLPTLGGRSMIPILKKLDLTVKQVLIQYHVNKINLIGHSAGGWISRIYLGEKPYNIHGDVKENDILWGNHPYIANLITLGTPHISQERWTRKNLDFVKDYYPGAFYPNVNYICVAGKAIYGVKKWDTWLTYSSYELTIGKGDTWGDGITPIEAAHLEGAVNLIIDNVYHSPKSKNNWYGSEEVLPIWAKYLS